MNVRYFEKRSGAWHIDFRDPEGRRLRPYAGTSRVEAERNAPAVIARCLQGGAPAISMASSIEGQPPDASARGLRAMTVREAYELAPLKRAETRTPRGLTEFRQVFNQLRLNDAAPVRLLDQCRVRELLEAWRREPGQAAGTTLAPSTLNARLSMVSSLLVNADLNLTHFRAERRSKSDPPPGRTAPVAGAGVLLVL